MSNESEGNMGQTSLLPEQERDLLDSWKEIAAYLNRNVRTVQRWEKLEGLPIHRHVHERASSVSARKKEIDAWQRQRSRVSDEITENQRELELVIERLKTRLLVKRMREALAIALHNDRVKRRKLTCYRATPPRPATPITISSHSGKSPTATFPFSSLTKSECARLK
jgi:hypothetical protein